MPNDILDWVPEFTIRRSRRAKRLSMRIVSGSLELVLPVRASVAAAHKFLASNRAWVDKNRHLLYTHDDNLPQSINLQFLQKETDKCNFLGLINQRKSFPLFRNS